MIDYSFLYDVSGNDAGYIYEVLNIFLDTVPDGINKLGHLINDTDDWEAIYKQAHFLKSSLGIIKISGLYEKVTEIETIAHTTKDKGKVKALFDEIFDIFSMSHPMIIKEKDKYALLK